MAEKNLKAQSQQQIQQQLSDDELEKIAGGRGGLDMNTMYNAYVESCRAKHETPMSFEQYWGL